MSVAVKLEGLREYIQPDGLELFSEIIQDIIGYEHSMTAVSLVNELNETSPDPHSLRQQSELLRQSLRQFYTPFYGQENAFKTDLKTFFYYLDYYLDNFLIDQARELMETYPRTFNPDGKTICNAQVSGCKGEINGEPCDYKFSEGEMVCPKCATPRRLCRQTPMANGRCRYHGGRATATNLGGRAGLYASATQNAAMLEALQYTMSDESDYLSMQGEIGIIGGRIAELFRETTEFNVLEQADVFTRKMQKADALAAKGKVDEALAEIRAMLNVAASVRHNESRWREIADLIAVMRPVVSEERQRRNDKQKTVTPEMVLAYRKQTMDVVFAAIAAASRAVGEYLAHRIKGEQADDLLSDMDLVSGRVIERRLRQVLSEEVRKDSQRQRAKLIKSGN